MAGGNNRRYVFGQDAIVQGYAVTNTGNFQVQSETNEQTNIGLDFRYFTHLYRTQKGNTYDYSYLLLPEEKVLEVNWQNYMGQKPR